MKIPALSAVVLAAFLSVRAEMPDLTGCFPPEIKTVGVVMPASILAKKTFDAGVRALEKAGYRVKLAPRLSFDRKASVMDRVSDFEEMWLDPDVDLVLCARGGSGAEDVIKRLDWRKLANRPNQKVLGFSNITMILNAMLLKGVGHPFSGPSISQMSYCRGDTLEWLCKSLGGKPLPAAQLRALRPGAISGLPCGGHIHYVAMGLKDGWGANMRGRVVFLERNPSATLEGIRKELDAIAASGCLDAAAGVIFGDVTAKADTKIRATDSECLSHGVEMLKRTFAAKVNCPVYDGYAYGHIPVSHAIDFRRQVCVSKDGLMTWGTSGCLGADALAVSPSFGEYTQRFEVTFATPEAALRATVSAADLPPGKAFAFSQRWDDANPRHLKMADVLDPLGIKATFYVNDCQADFVSVMTNLVARGHSLGDHTVAHDFMPLFLPGAMFREIMDCRIFIETESQTPVSAFGFPYGKTSMETDPEASRRYGQALTNAGILGSPQKKENPFEILGVDPSRWVATHYFSINDKDPDAELFRIGMDLTTNLALKAEGPIGPHVTMGTHTWQSDEGLVKLSKILSAIAGRSDIWFVNENEWIAARLQKLSARFRRISVRDRTAVYEVTRPESSDLGAAMPLFLTFSEPPISVRTEAGADVLKAGLPVEEAHLPPKRYRRLPADALTIDDALSQVACSFRNESGSDWSEGVATLRLPPGFEPGTVRRPVGPLSAGGETNISFTIKRSANTFNDGFYAAVQIDLAAPEGKTRLWARVERTNDALPLESAPRDTCTAAGPFPVAADPGPKFFAGLSRVGSPLRNFAGEAGVWRAARRETTHHPSVGDATEPGWTRYTVPGHRLAVAYDLDADVAAHGTQWKLSLAVMNQGTNAPRVFLNGQEVSSADPLTLVQGRNRILFVHDFGKISNFLHELTIASEKDGTSAAFRRVAECGTTD